MRRRVRGKQRFSSKELETNTFSSKELETNTQSMIFLLSFSNQWQQHPILGAIPSLLRWIIYWFFSSRRRTLHAVASSDIWILWNISMICMPVKGMVRAAVLAVIKLQTCTTDGAWLEFPLMLHGQNFCKCCMVRSSSSWCGWQIIQSRRMSSFIR